MNERDEKKKIVLGTKREEEKVTKDSNNSSQKDDPVPKDQFEKLCTYKIMRSNAFLSPTACTSLVQRPQVIVLVGLPARGKTYISRKLCRYLNWIGIRTKVFNVGEYRRTRVPIVDSGNDFFDPFNDRAYQIRTECAKRALEDMCQYLERGDGEVAIFDATNTTRQRRKMVLDACLSGDPYMFRVFFVESVCDDPKVVEANITDVKVNSPDYVSMDSEKAKEDFMKRIQHYQKMYEPLDDKFDVDKSYIRVINAGKSFFVHNVQGHVQSRVVYFLMNIHLMKRCIYLSRHGESEYNLMGRLGGDSPLSEGGQKYAKELRKYFESEKVRDLRVWSSQKIRAVQTAEALKDIASYTEYWKALDEIDAGVCEGLTYAEVQERYPQQLLNRDIDKYHYRYPSGESYEDLLSRLEPVIMELERQSNVLVISHQAVLRCLMAYFLDKDSRKELPYLRVPLHSVLKLTPIAYGCQLEKVEFSIEAVDTHRDKRSWSVSRVIKSEWGTSRSPEMSQENNQFVTNLDPLQTYVPALPLGENVAEKPLEKKGKIGMVEAMV